ncbi:hypothetical protein TPA0909_30950 [Streptomyces albus]|nr:hypothetical protein TPA0909_30950 [Streptomyces albus]
MARPLLHVGYRGRPQGRNPATVVSAPQPRGGSGFAAGRRISGGSSLRPLTVRRRQSAVVRPVPRRARSEMFGATAVKWTATDGPPAVVAGDQVVGAVVSIQWVKAV